MDERPGISPDRFLNLLAGILFLLAAIAAAGTTVLGLGPETLALLGLAAWAFGGVV